MKSILSSSLRLRLVRGSSHLNRQIAFEIRHLLAAVLVGFSVNAAMAQKDTEASGNATTGSPTYYPSPIQPGSEPQSPDPYGNNGLGFQEFGFPAPELNKMDWNARFGPDTCGPFYLPPIPPALGEQFGGCRALF